MSLRDIQVLADTNTAKQFDSYKGDVIGSIGIRTFEKTVYLISQKIRYLLRRDDAIEEVPRKFRDIVWLHSQLKRDFSGLKIPACPDNNLESVRAFFKEILKIEDIASSYLLLFFVSCTSGKRLKEFVLVKSNAALTGKTEVARNLNLEGFAVTEQSLQELKKAVASRPEIKKAPGSDFDLLADNAFEFTQFLLAEFAELAKCLVEVKSLFETLSQKMSRAAESFGMIALQFKKLNFAKSQFPDFEQSNINLDLVFTRYKLIFYESSQLTRQRYGQPVPGLREVPPVEKRAELQRRRDCVQGSVQNTQKQNDAGELNRTTGQTLTSTSLASSSRCTSTFKRTRSTTSASTPWAPTTSFSNRFTRTSTCSTSPTN